ncbi:MAG: hypothetical protein U1D30_21690 [Planctomycetota bacterium]
MTDGRRRSARNIPIEGEMAYGMLITQGKKIPVLIADESAEGMGLVAVNASELQLGGSILFESSVRRVEGKIGSIRHVRMPDVRIYHVGIEWEN